MRKDFPMPDIDDEYDEEFDEPFAVHDYDGPGQDDLDYEEGQLEDDWREREMD
jgi:hypothetical protein